VGKVLLNHCTQQSMIALPTGASGQESLASCATSCFVMVYQQQQSGALIYPRSIGRKLAWRFPLILWRTGLSPLLRYLPMLVMSMRGRKSGVVRPCSRP
jgi:hypothetical protein